jgi:hypothetical protein
MKVQKSSSQTSPAAGSQAIDLKEALRIPHDLGGESGGPIPLEERQQEPWELNTFVTCECLAWRGVWNTVEKHRRHADLGELQYLSMPYYGRWLLAAARALIDKDHVTITELTRKIDEVKKRHGKESVR